jgi:YrbI family 3-deoxy-D-manno-octulosonate 8-phosphate phosphatase
MTDNIYAQCKQVKLLVLDVDGTMTDGTVYYSANGEELKRFSIRDGMGIELLRIANIPVAIITSENSNIVRARASKLNIENVLLGSRNKKQSLIELIEKLGVALEEVAYIGDDVNDIQALEIAGVSACPADANKYVKYVCDYICQSDGGRGAVREVVELILLSQNKSIILPENW